ncbi:phage/plasmid primase, P4 family [Microbacterium sp. KKR3/1]|uniref:DNA primase family protein n=1 Tax=Microbacterium sp. KKR3/1 TaxID=2904241 RepID=UPI001E466708|nr:phage/plasmid primase, P4 family [Microbacterium sp. KKR3/1]MCE0507950.1 phage/plasmid primase, P4 family [Microbacterium sp. KKR3/1]
MSDIEYPQHDSGNAARLADNYGHLFRWVTDWQAFIRWDGKRWERLPDQTAIEALAKESALDIATDARRSLNTDAVSGLVKWSAMSLDMPRIRACVNAVRSVESIRIHSDVLDTRPHLLNCGNGTVDLRTGEMHEHAQSDMLTQIVPRDFRSDLMPTPGVPLAEHAKRIAPQFTTLVKRAFQFDETDQTLGWMLMTFGYAAIGDNPEQVFFILYGQTNTGKSQSLECVSNVLGRDYADATLNPDLVSKTRNGAHTEDTNKLAGRRFGVIDEVSDDIDLNEQEIKRLTGQREKSVRAIYGKARTVTRTWTLFLALNSMPNVEKWDAAISRRVISVLSGPTVPEAERRAGLADAISAAEGDAILALVVAGARAYYSLAEKGLVYGKDRLPGHVARSTKHIADSTDHIQRFYDEWLEVGQGYRTRKGDIVAKYKQFREFKENTHSPQAIANRIEEIAHSEGLDFVTRNGSDRYMLGVQLRAMARSDEAELTPSSVNYQ